MIFITMDLLFYNSEYFTFFYVYILNIYIYLKITIILYM